MAYTILLVCTGNTCRSSMAEALLKKIIEETEEHAERVEVISAGLAAREGDPATPQAIQAMEEEGIDLSLHTARRLTEELINKADLILTMTEEHKKQVLLLEPRSYDKLFTLKEYARIQEEEKENVSSIQEEIRKKKEHFLNQHGFRLRQLHHRQLEILRESEEIKNELKDLEDAYNKAVQREEDKLNRLREGKENLDILDPFGQSLEVYQKTAQEIKENLVRAWERFKREVLQNQENNNPS